MGAEVPFLRPEHLSDDYVNISDVLSYMLERIEHDSNVRDLVVVLEETHPFRPSGMIDSMILQLLSEGMDSLVAAKEERRRLWISDSHGVLNDVGDPAFMPRRFKSHQVHIGLFGLGCVTQSNFIRNGNILGNKKGLYVVDEPFSMIEIKSQLEFEKYAAMLDSWLAMAAEQQQ
jgi:N-acylneuraminate cytidylyltransferase